MKKPQLANPRLHGAHGLQHGLQHGLPDLMSDRLRDELGHDDDAAADFASGLPAAAELGVQADRRPLAATDAESEATWRQPTGRRDARSASFGRTMGRLE